MKHKIYSQLWIYFACLVFFTLVLFAIFVAGIMLLLNRYQLLPLTNDNHLMGLIILSIFSILVGTVSSLLVGRRILAPIKELSQKMNKVAAGDFSVTADTNQKVEEVQQLFRNFNGMVTELNSIETLQNDFVANVSHEFKTPIATIQGYIQLLQQETITLAESNDYFQRIYEATSQLATLSENILRLTKLETQSSPLEKQVFRLDEQIREVLLFLQPKWEEKQLQLDLRLAPTSFLGNEELLYQVWLNLMDNAIKYSPVDQKVAVTLKAENHHLQICFYNHGFLIPQKEQRRIFDKFYQGDTSRKTNGNGLGLALVKEIISHHEGYVEAFTTPDNATCFQVTLPLATADS